jgi:hypothetical protein
VYRNTHYQVLNQGKREFKQAVKAEIHKLPQYGKPVEIYYTVYLRRKGDIMNVASIVDKFFQDALTDLGKLVDDNCDHVKKVTVEFGGIDKENPRCDVELRSYNGQPEIQNGA